MLFTHCTANFTGLMMAFNSGSSVIPLAVSGGICLIGAMSFHFIVGKIEPLQARPSSPLDWSSAETGASATVK